MHVATKRSLIAAAAITAAGLFGSLPYEGASVAQQGVPTVHHDVALVDVSQSAADAAAAVDYTPLLNAEEAVNTTLYNLSVGDNGLYETLYNSLGADLSESLLQTDGNGGIYEAFGGEYLNIFNGAATAGYNGFISNTLAFNAELNNILGVPMDDSQAALLVQFNDLFVGAVPATLGDPELGDSFIPDLVAIANSQYTLASNDLIEYTQNLFTNYTDILDSLTSVNLGDLLTDLTSGLTTLTEGLTDNINDLINAIITLF
ncbi:hypothetical protein PT015_02605 [Candidatus Mycobacterium wuenschmannii]|uniref:Secreted protein n=1 Tax=Candidatus Mycobacterium wuenschmannii TaxID=3027808 RepID=A0ABY8VXR0_9MYCO|nr:hypothetical protein [Candidatus Mycobacterium wuenschmannii]WIM88414.1 hypothetical protein PT015_02605 [Candidatus Mycobacterium wuenschmannii]